MADRISQYRVVRLAIHVPPTGGATARWTLVATGVRRGIPHAAILLDGSVRLPGPAPTTEEILEAVHAIAEQSMLL